MSIEQLKKLIESNPKNDNKTNYEVCKGLSEVCVMLSNSKESSEEQKKRFIQFSEMFSKFANFHKAQINQREVQMQKQKSRKDMLLEEKRKKALARKEEDNKVKEVISEIKYLDQYDVLYGRNRQIVKDILSSIETQTSEDLDENLVVLRRMVRTNVNKVMQ